MGHGLVSRHRRSGAIFLLILAVLGLMCGAFALAVIHAETVSAWWRALPQHLRGRGWGLLLLPVAVMAAVMAGDVHVLAVVEPVIAGVLLVLALARRWLDPRRGGILPRQGLLLVPVVVGPTLPSGPGWPEWSAGSPRLMASWR